MLSKKHFKIMADALVESLLANREFWTNNGVVTADHIHWTEEKIVKAYVNVLARNYANFNTSRFLDYVQRELNTEICPSCSGTGGIGHCNRCGASGRVRRNQ